MEFNPRQAAPAEQWFKKYKREGGDSHRITVYVRSLSPVQGLHRHQVKLFEQLDEVVDRDLCDRWELTVLGKSICLCESCRRTGAGAELRETALELSEWQRDGLTASGFSTRTVDSALTDERYRLLVPPEVAFGVYREGSLVGVFPCETDSTMVKPADVLEDLTEKEIEQRESPAVSSS